MRMFIKYTTVIIVLILTSCLCFVSAIRCYECNSVNNSMCLEPTQYDAETLTKFLPTTTCGQGVLSAGHHGFFCRKIVQTIFHKGYEPDVRVTRSCGWIRYHRDCYKADNEDHIETVCQCFEDDCNGTNRLQHATVIAMFSALGLKFVW